MNPSSPGGATLPHCSLMSKQWRCITPLLYRSSESSYVNAHFCDTQFTSVHWTSRWKSSKTCLYYTTHVALTLQNSGAKKKKKKRSAYTIIA